MGDGYFVGIDLGTANCCLAYTKNSSEPEIFPFGDSDLMPSVITFSEDKIFVGADAIRNMKGPWSTTSYFKNIMGEKIARTFNGTLYDTSELAAVLIRKMLNEFRNKTGEDVKNAVITIPSDFGDLERHATYNAAKIAGLDRVFLLSETLAAAISYGEEKKLSKGNIIIYDFGAGTFDVAVVNVKNGVYRVLADESSRDMGGRELDMEIAALLFRKIVDNSGLKANDPAFDSEFRMRLMIEADITKIHLQSEESRSGTIRVGDREVEYTATRDEIEMETYVLLLKTINLLGVALRNSRLDMEKIDEIVMVGCSSTMYMVQDVLKKSFPSVKLELHHPKFAVSRGAAIYAESRYGDRERVLGIPVMTKTYGILGGIDGMEMVCNMIYRNEPIPARAKLSCRPKRDDQDKLHIVVYESMAKHGEAYVETESGKVAMTLDVPLKGRISRGWTKITIYADADKYGKVTFNVECNGESNRFTFIDEINLTEEEISKSKEKMRCIQ